MRFRAVRGADSRGAVALRKSRCEYPPGGQVQARLTQEHTLSAQPLLLMAVSLSQLLSSQGL